MSIQRVTVTCAVGLALLLAACDDDPARPGLPAFELTDCPVGPLEVNAPLALAFTRPVAAATVTGGNVVVSNAETGVEIPGSLTLTNAANAGTVTFTPADPLPFSTRIRVRVQNLLADVENTPIELTVCEVETGPPPITELFWRQLPSATGNRLLGASLIGPDTGFVASISGPIFRRRGGEFVVTSHSPYLAGSFDVAFVSLARGFAVQKEGRSNVALISESVDSGRTFTPIRSLPGETLTRTFFRRLGPGPNDVFGVVGGGAATIAHFLKFVPATSTFVEQTFTGTSGVTDIDFAIGDTVNGAATSGGFVLGSLFRPGKVFVTRNGGSTWAEIPEAQATDTNVMYRGVAIRRNGEIFAVGGSGHVVRLRPRTGGGFDVERLLRGVVPNPDPTNPEAFIFTDIEFAPGDDTRGWLVGAVQVAVSGGTPQYQGLIFETRDGGATWVRQGVQGAGGFGAEFPRLNRIEVFSATEVWIVGDAGVVLEYQP